MYDKCIVNVWFNDAIKTSIMLTLRGKVHKYMNYFA